MNLPTGGGPATTLIGSLCLPFGLAVDRDNTYWADTCGVEVGRIPIAGGAPAEVVPRGAHEPSSAMAADGKVFFTDASASDARILKVSRDGGVVTVLMSSP